MLKGMGLLNSAQQNGLSFFAQLPDSKVFFLTGGTALSEFFLGHRYSYDLDFFTGQDNLIQPFSQQLKNAASQHGLSLEVVRRFNSFVDYLFHAEHESVRIQLAQDSPFRFQSPLESSYGVCVNDWVDLITDKLLAFYGREEPCDAADLSFILQEEISDDLLLQAEQKDPAFDRYWLAVACQRVRSFPDETENWPLQTIQPFQAVVLKQFYNDLSDKLMKDISP